ncbi:MAG: bifunctional riboflavin kinase/FAD synthetase [Capsulimonadales bacterium]|nr:bifunctional riboflavin kinase/FAD synthetase [Capsulimonadales bacterium]
MSITPGTPPVSLPLDLFRADTPLAVCLGVFDGVHRGHQALLERAARFEWPVVAVTFDPHPAALLSPNRTPPMLGTLTERAEWLHHYGARQVLVARFDRAFAAMAPEEFIATVLRDRLSARVVVVGEDFRFGCDRSGDVETLRLAGQRAGFLVEAVGPVFVGGVPARSTTVRQMLSAGRVEEAALLLGRPYRLSGTVTRGKQLGRTIGFPTANLAVPPEILVPAAGIYAAAANLSDGSRCRAAVSIGTNPTVTPENRERTVEAFLMDGFAGDLYDQALSLEFFAFLRPMLTFESLEALVEQMGRDVAEAARRVPLR